MKAFVDNAGRTWAIHIHVESIKRVRNLAQVDLLCVVESDFLLQLANDPILLCDVLFALCHDEVQEKNISEVDFGKAMAGEVIEQAREALLRELLDFFHHRKRRLPNAKQIIELPQAMFGSWFGILRGCFA